MAEWPDPRIAPNNAGVTVDGRAIGSAAIDQGLRSHMLKVYNYMASAVLLTGIIALVFAQSGLALQVLSTPLRYVLMFANQKSAMIEASCWRLIASAGCATERDGGRAKT